MPHCLWQWLSDFFLVVFQSQNKRCNSSRTSSNAIQYSSEIRSSPKRSQRISMHFFLNEFKILWNVTLYYLPKLKDNLFQSQLNDDWRKKLSYLHTLGMRCNFFKGKIPFSFLQCLQCASKADVILFLVNFFVLRLQHSIGTCQVQDTFLIFIGQILKTSKLDRLHFSIHHQEIFLTAKRVWYQGAYHHAFIDDIFMLQALLLVRFELSQAILTNHIAFQLAIQARNFSVEI